MSAAAVGRPPAPRRSTSVSSGSTHSPSSSISKGATARAAASPRVPSNLSPASRRGSIKSSSPPAITGETRESLALALRHETDAKEQLLVQLQDKEQIITSLTQENDHMSSALNAAESRLSELYAEQNRMEEEMSARIEVAEKLRQQVRELEKEKRDLTRRYNEQTSTFEAERQTFYDNETHLKSRIQSLMQARKNQPPPTPTSPSLVDVTDTEDEADEEQQAPEVTSAAAKEDEDSEPAEMTSLRMELSTLESSYASMQNTVSLLQHQLSDLKRVNRTLQEDNESYMILLREKTLSGQFNVMRMGNASEDSESSSDLDTEERDEDGDRSSMRSGSRSYLGTVSEHPDERDETLDPDYDNQLSEDGERLGEAEGSESALGGSRTRHSRRPVSSTHSPKQRGESLANLPISGPGLDLAAELGRAENKDVLENPIDPPPSARQKKGRKSTGEGRGGMEPSDSANDIHAMRSRVKMLEDANKALSLYASKIIDRIIAQEGFEHVLAVDYEANKSPGTPAFAPPPPSKEEKHRRRATMFAGSSNSQMPTSPQPERLTTFESIMSPKPMPPPTTAPANKRRSLSFDWRGFSLFGGDKKPEGGPPSRSPALNTNVRNVSGPSTARKLDTEEDEEDRKERERLHATMKLMGIDKPMPPPMVKSHTAPDSTNITPATPTDPSSTVSSPPSRFSFFRRPAVTSETSSIRSTPSTSDEPVVLTHDALVQSEAESALAALDVHERQLSVELAKGGSSGFTEIQRKSRRGRASGGGSGSGSTVWSAGMSHQGEHGDE
ncbi:unnamed protein product [Peniophora sp. CBMAI 1063]|nr:unnamed protein product [Peniophora sp. CBMAI 1063]